MKNQEPTGVKVWEEQLVIPTYPVSSPEKEPLFIEKRAYQGSSGKVYPLPVTEKLSDKKLNCSYRAVFLENEYLKIMVLPELGGRIQRALDKTNHYDFIYYNHVIKPALVGLCGPWISGGLEFNWPQHHRPSTFMPVNCSWSENKDGSASILVGETDRMYGTRGMARFTLYPGKAYLEIKGQLYNCTETPQTFLWWANPAVPVNDHTYSVFPPDVHAVMDHGKRAVMTFPLATGEYYKYDYAEGVDISRYRNIKVPTSYMAAHSDYDFIGNFDEEKDAGLLHVADHHIAPGKKQWTWGNADFGKAWDRNLTDSDGPYIELMTGVYADNQPDFTWLKPFEEKTFTQYFMPYKHVGHVKNASRDAAVGLEHQDGRCTVRVYASSAFPEARITVRRDGEILFFRNADLSPTEPFEAAFRLEPVSAAASPVNPEPVSAAVCSAPEGTDASFCAPELYAVEVRDANKRLLVSYAEKPEQAEPLPAPAVPLPLPAALKSPEELLLAARHLEQYRHATFEPADYYQEGLRRDPTDIRLNNGYGLLLLKRGKFSESLPYFRTAVKKETWKNPNPYNGESYWNLGLGLLFTGAEKEAFDAFYKSVWSAETQSAGYYLLSCLSARKKDYEIALEFAEKSLIGNWHHMKARVLKAALLRLTDRASAELLSASASIDPLDTGIRYETALLNGNMSAWIKFMGKDTHNYLSLSLDYGKAGFYADAIAILKACPEPNPMIFYCTAYFHSLQHMKKEALSACRKGEEADLSWCFPNRLEEIPVLETCIRLRKENSLSAAHAEYLLGCLYYDKKQYETAAALWESATAADHAPAAGFRNLAIYACNRKGENAKALSLMKKAVSLDPGNTRFLMEYDSLKEKAGIPAEKRLRELKKNSALLPERDVLYLTYISLLNTTGRYQEARKLITGHTFHPWEGGEGKVIAQYRYALTGLAVSALRSGKYETAIRFLNSTLSYPENLGEGKLPNVQDNMTWYWLGKAYQGLQKADQATACFKKASTGLTEPGTVLYYNDQPCDTIFYQGLAAAELGNEKDARKWFHKLLSFGSIHIFDQTGYDYFAVSLPEIAVFSEDLQDKNETWCRYLMALGHLGLHEHASYLQRMAEIHAKHPEFQSIAEFYTACNPAER